MHEYTRTRDGSPLPRPPPQPHSASPPSLTSPHSTAKPPWTLAQLATNEPHDATAISRSLSARSRGSPPGTRRTAVLSSCDLSACLSIPPSCRPACGRWVSRWLGEQVAGGLACAEEGMSVRRHNHFTLHASLSHTIM